MLSTPVSPTLREASGEAAGANIRITSDPLRFMDTGIETGVVAGGEPGRTATGGSVEGIAAHADTRPGTVQAGTGDAAVQASARYCAVQAGTRHGAVQASARYGTAQADARRSTPPDRHNVRCRQSGIGIADPTAPMTHRADRSGTNSRLAPFRSALRFAPVQQALPGRGRQRASQNSRPRRVFRAPARHGFPGSRSLRLPGLSPSAASLCGILAGGLGGVASHGERPCVEAHVAHPQSGHLSIIQRRAAPAKSSTNVPRPCLARHHRRAGATPGVPSRRSP